MSVLEPEEAPCFHDAARQHQNLHHLPWTSTSSGRHSVQITGFTRGSELIHLIIFNLHQRWEQSFEASAGRWVSSVFLKTYDGFPSHSLLITSTKPHYSDLLSLLSCSDPHLLWENTATCCSNDRTASVLLTALKLHVCSHFVRAGRSLCLTISGWGTHHRLTLNTQFVFISVPLYRSFKKLSSFVSHITVSNYFFFS